MAKYKVKVISVSLNNGKIADYGDVVNGALLAGDPKTLEEKGYVKKVKKGKDSDDNKSELELKQAEIGKMTVQDLKDYVSEKDLDVNVEQNKPELLADVLATLKE